MGGSGLQRELNRTQKVEAALQNEYLTRGRVEKLEATQRRLGRVLDGISEEQIPRMQAIIRRRFWGRLFWLLFGR